ncbi:YfhO family protein [Loigolactobacillus iwatensis]|uniref:YfhO family protein n=1 Tax=Loigolactobacillus iwatensis TaxID=1267156 RepID=UPI001CDD4205|nr:YfhO family protein [Loigolactobacillus iwatensis]
MQIIRFFKKHAPLLLSFFAPIIIMGSYFAIRHMFPFGNNSLLTVDLGQQYIDFYAFFRDTILHHPDQILYSFSKAIGGDMLGVWAYYLMSPFNLLLLLTPGKWLTFGVMLMTLLKYGSSGLTFAILLKRTKVQTKWGIPTFAISYALMGWLVANQLNVMWLDAAVFLPLVVLGVEKIFNGKSYLFYSFLLGCTLVINYYMGYMICLFLITYMFWASFRHWSGWRKLLTAWRKFIVGSFLGAGLAAALLLPTFYALTQSKAKYTLTHFKWQFEYSPLKMLSKFVVGAFNFDQMPTGYPNIFVGSLVLLGFVLYFLSHQIGWRERLSALVVSFFFFFSLCLQPLDLVWHAMQFPIWYPYRFSFVICFWLVWLAAIALKANRKLTSWQIGVLALLLIGFDGYVYFHLDQFNFLKPSQLLLTVLFGFLALIFLALRQRVRLANRYFGLIFVSFAIIEMATNAYLSLNQISYVSQSDYANYTAELVKVVKRVKAQNKTNDFYRIEKTFMRTKNDSMEANYNSASHFSSTFEAKIPNFMGRLGQPAGDGFITYSNGTLFTDAFLGMKYYLDAKPESKGSTTVLPPLTDKPDLAFYREIGQDKLTKTYQNNYALPLGFAASNKILEPVKNSQYPTLYQSTILNHLMGSKQYTSLFMAQQFATVTYHNVRQDKAPLTETYKKINKKKNGTITYRFTPTTSDPYYLTIGSNLNSKAVSFTVNNHPLQQYDTFRDTVIVDLAAAEQNQPVTLTITLKQPEVWLQNFQLYHFNTAALNQATQTLQAHPWRLTHNSNTHLTGKITIPHRKQVMMTTIPAAKGWHLRVDGHPKKFKQVLGSLIAIPLSKGSHTVSLTYWPPYLTLGLIISGLSGLVDLLVLLYLKIKHH